MTKVLDEVEAGSERRTLRERLTILTLAHATTHMRGAILPLIYPLVMSSMRFGYLELGVMLSVTRLIGGLLQGLWGHISRYVRPSGSSRANKLAWASASAWWV